MAEHPKTVKGRIAHPRHTTAEWVAAKDAVLYNGEIGFEVKTDGSVMAKVGDGTNTWGDLPYWGGLGGNDAESAKKLASARAIDGVAFDGSAAITHYGTCGEAASTAAKTVSCTGFILTTGARIAVKFTYGNTVASPSLNVNGTAAINIKKYGTTASMAYMWQPGELVEFVYDGTNYVMQKGGLATSDYYGLVKLSTSTSSTSTELAATPSAVKSAYDLANSKLSKASAVSVTITASGWNSDSTANYPYYYDITVSSATASDIAMLTIAPASMATATECGFCETTQTLSGKIRVRAVKAPTASISAEYWLIKGA